MSDEESRSERLRQRRQKTTEKAQSSDASEPSEMSEPSKPSKPSDPTVKEEQVGTYMYLPESQKKEVDRLYNVLKADYEFEFDDELEKNRMFYPLLIQYGLDGLEGLDAQEVKERLEDR